MSPPITDAAFGDIDELPEAEGKSPVVEARNFATHDEFVYRHRWRAGDLVMWDNPMTMHRVTELRSGSRRPMQRTTRVGDEPRFER